MKPSNVKQTVLLVAAAAVFGYLVWRLVPMYWSGSEDPQSIERLAKEAAALNRSLPAVLDKETELMITEAAHAMFIYKYRLLNISVGRVNAEKFQAEAKPRLVQSACNRPEIRNDFLTKGVTMRFSYFDKDKQHIATIDVTPADCGL